MLKLFSPLQNYSNYGCMFVFPPTIWKCHSILTKRICASVLLSHITSRVFLPSFLPVCERFLSKHEVNRGSDDKTSVNLRISGVTSLQTELIQCKISFLSSLREPGSRGKLKYPYFLSLLISDCQLTLNGNCREGEKQQGLQSGAQVKENTSFLQTAVSLEWHRLSEKVKSGRFKVKKGLLLIFFSLAFPPRNASFNYYNF